MSGVEGQAAASRFAEAHRALRADPSIQFAMDRAVPPKPPQIPGWLRWLLDALAPIGRFFKWVTSLMPAAPLAQIILWTVIVLFVMLLVWLIADRLRSGEWRAPLKRRRPRQVAAEEADVDWAPDVAPVRAWLDEADALAARGLYAEAVHHLLFRSIEDIQRRRPRVVRPSLTSRELAATSGIPTVARELFARIAGYVESSLFGGRPVVADDWLRARAAYADFALPGQWKA